MKAALLIEPGRIEVSDVPGPSPGPGEVRVAVGGVGLCGSDVSVFSGRWQAPAYPWLMGHEAFGIVEAVGRGVPASRIGQSVVVEPNIACRSCGPCASGWTSACEARQSIGMNRPGALAELLVVPDDHAWPMAGRPEDLVCVEPTTVVTAALRRLGGPLPPTALVIGVGPQGLLMTLVLAGRGVAVAVHDLSADRVEHAEALGARRLDLESGDRFGLVVDTVGAPAAASLALDRLEVNGTILVLGLDSSPLAITAQGIVRRQATLRGSLTYDHPGDFAATIRDIGDGALTPGRVVTDVYSLDEIQRAFERSGHTRGKSWIRIGASEES